MRYLLLIVIIIFSSGLSFAQQKGYHIFKPIPRAQLRVFSLDRPDITESPQTVDAGHFQFEGDVIKWDKDTRDGDGTLLLWNGLYKIGLNHNMDFQIGYELFNINPNLEGLNTKNGHGALTFRLKRNLWGNDGETRTALGALPYISYISGIPFDSSQGIAYGCGFPFSYSLNDKLDLGLQPQIDFVPNATDGHDFNFFQTVVVGGELIGALDFYTEFVMFLLKGEQQYLADGGLIYNISPNVKIDIAGNYGLTKNSPSRIYLGLSFRI